MDFVSMEYTIMEYLVHVTGIVHVINTTHINIGIILCHHPYNYALLSIQFLVIICTIIHIHTEKNTILQHKLGKYHSNKRVGTEMHKAQAHT